MAYEFSLAQLTVLHCPPPDMVKLAAECGYEYASLRPQYMGLPGEPNYELSKNPQMLRDTKRSMADTGVKIHDVELFRILPDKDMRDYEPALAAGAELGAKNALSSIWTDDIPYAKEQFGILAEIAGKYDMTVNLEFVTWAGVWNLQGVIDVLKSQTARNVAALIDTLHFSRSRVSLSELDELPDEWVRFIHICDGPAEIPGRADKEALIHTGRDARLYVGEGGIDIAAILNRLPERVCSVELPNLERVKELGYQEHARRCLVTAKKYFAEKGVAGRL
jgi:sugar phosphate isomerase/epimerase